MPHVFAFDEVNDELGNVLGMVANALDSLGQEQQIQAGRDRAGVFHHVGDELAHKAIELLVDKVVLLEDGQRRLGVQPCKSIQRLAEMGIDISAISYRVALFDIDLYSGMYELDTEKQQESALMAFVLYNISDEIVTREEAGFAYQEGNNRVGILFQEKWSRNFTSRTKESKLDSRKR